jgi:hypothetical protein
VPWKLFCGLELAVIGLLLLAADLEKFGRKIMDKLDELIRARFKDERGGHGDHVIDEADPADALNDGEDRDDRELPGVLYWPGV